jgi:DNA-binding beta-propeller fold protein YncE
MVRTDLVVTLGKHDYAVERPWGALPPGVRLEGVSNVAVDSRDRVYVYQRSDPTLVIFNGDGSYVGSLASGLVDDAHGLDIDGHDRIWLIDRDAHVIHAIDQAGNIVQSLGSQGRPRFQEPFNHPAGIAIAPDGEIYVADGYGNSRVHHFAADGAFLGSWGKPGSGDGEFTTPHAVAIDPRDRVLVADRENNRVQLFDRQGKFLEAWGDLYHPMDIYVDRAGMIYVTDQIPRLSLFSPEGELVGRCRPVLTGAHGIAGDAQGNIYLSEMSPVSQVTRLTPLSE